MKLDVHLFGTRFQNPVLLAAGTCGFGRELADAVDIERLGGFVTKSVTLEPRAGNPGPACHGVSGRHAELDRPREPRTRKGPSREAPVDRCQRPANRGSSSA